MQSPIRTQHGVHVKAATEDQSTHTYTLSACKNWPRCYSQSWCLSSRLSQKDGICLSGHTNMGTHHGATEISGGRKRNVVDLCGEGSNPSLAEVGTI